MSYFFPTNIHTCAKHYILTNRRFQHGVMRKFMCTVYYHSQYRYTYRYYRQSIYIKLNLCKILKTTCILFKKDRSTMFLKWKKCMVTASLFIHFILVLSNINGNSIDEKAGERQSCRFLEMTQD